MRSVLMAMLPAACVAWSNVQAQSGEAPQFTGQELVNIHCVRCHAAPSPTDVAREEWPRTLAAMGLYLGFQGDEFPDFASVEAGRAE